MPNTVKVPLLGNVPKGGVIAGSLTAVAVGGYALYRHYQSKAAAPGDASAYGYGEYAYGYGSDMYGYGTGFQPFPYGEAYGYGDYGYGMYNPYTGGYIGPPVPTPGTVPGAPTTNLQWLQEANTALGGKKKPALWAYLGGLPLLHAQEITVQEALGVMGDPPTPGPNGYPPKWHSAPKPGQSGPQYITASGHQTLWQIAHAHHVSEAKLVSLNPKLAHYVGSKKNIPRGTRVRIK